MYQFKQFARSISLLLIFAFLGNGSSALAANGLSVNKNGRIIKAKAAMANNPPGSQMRDLNADGTLDFITTHSKRGGVSIALGLGNGRFEQRMNYLTGKKPLTVRIRDVNGDNKLDLVAYNFKRKTVTVLYGDGNGSFTEQNVVSMNPAPAPQQSGQNNPTPPPSTPVSPTAQPTTNTAVVTGIAALEQSINQKINAYRASRRLAALPLNATISSVARTHSQNMATGKVPFGHQGFNARVQTISKTITFRSAGENVSYNQGYSDPATVAVNGWLKSQGHLNNIIGNYNLTGIGVARSSNGAYYFTQIFWRQ